MKKAFILIFITSFVFACSKKDNVKPPVVEVPIKVTGTVIGKETCKTDASQDYWLIELEPSEDSSIGDAATFGGKNYNHLVKTRNLKTDAKVIGKKFVFEYVDFNDIKVETTGCQVANPITLTIHELFVSGYTGV